MSAAFYIEIFVPRPIKISEMAWREGVMQEAKIKQLNATLGINRCRLHSSLKPVTPVWIQ
jgi:hypothetical protein